MTTPSSSPSPSPSPSYLPLSDLYDRYRALATRAPEWCTLEEIGESRAGHPIYVLTLTAQPQSDEAQTRPALWVDAGTHAAEWAGISAALFSAELWIEALCRGDRSEIAWFSVHAVYLIPCLCPDGYEALWGERAYLRSTLRPPRADQPRQGLCAQDLTGDGVIRWMRWRHPAGPFVEDRESAGVMRARRIDDDPSEAFFFCVEGVFEQWDGWRWEQAPRAWVESLDLNRNFPASWQSFKMFGMDGGPYPLSEPESRAVVDAFAARPYIAAAITHHTFTGALLTQPYRKQSPMCRADIELMEALGKQAVAQTDYRVIRVYPDFVYDDEMEVVGVWSDTLSSTFGIPGYTLELWDPFRFCGIDNPNPAQFFRAPDPDRLRGLIEGFQEVEGGWTPWTSYEHPQLGAVELGGLDFMMTVRNPPPHELEAECLRAHSVVHRMRRALPKVTAEVEISAHGEGLYHVQLKLENSGFLSTSSLQRGTSWSHCPTVSVTLEIDDPSRVLEGALHRALPHLSGWGEASLSVGGLSPSLAAQGHRQMLAWWVRGAEDLSISWTGGRGGKGRIPVDLRAYPS